MTAAHLPKRISILSSFVSACALLVPLAACSADARQAASAPIQRLDGTSIDASVLTERIEELTRAARVHGLTVTIFNNAHKVYSQAFGVANLPVAKTLQTSTEIYGASLSKAVFSVLVMRLVEQGVIDLDKPLQDYVKEPLWQNRGPSWHENLSDLRSDPRYQRITARMSMSHTTGLPGWRWFEPDQKLRIHFEPGEKFSYSGEGMTLLQIVIDKITGTTLEPLMQEYVFRPYAMKMSSYTWQPRFEVDYAVGHASDGKPYPKDKDNAARAPSTLETTTDDYARFMSAVLRREGLTEGSWNEMFKPHVRIRTRTQVGPGSLETTTANDGIELSYGLGWGLQRTPHGWGAFKEGHGDGFQHYSIVYPSKKLGVLLMSNSDNAESIFGHLLRLTIADTFTPLEWENYVAYDDISKHKIQVVEVENGVQLEVLDWGGSGRPVVLLAGSGHTAHVFDDIAPKLTGCCHVYGITRRGYGASSRPTTGYDDQRLADDVLGVLDSLKIEGPVLAGHSMAGGELTTLGNQHSTRISGLVYLDALGDPRDFPASDPAYRALFENLPAPMRRGPSPDFSSFRAYRDAQTKSGQGAFPESELRQLFAANADGTVGRYKASTQTIHEAIGAGQKQRDYSNIRVPVLALFEFIPPASAPPRPDEYQPQSEEERAAIAAYRRATAAYVERWMDNLKKGVPGARVVDLPGAGHFVFLTREAEVLKEIRKFVASTGVRR
ncbi:MAG: alpha/beta fold hydrolase [Vicinamibacterales bacterium]